MKGDEFLKLLRRWASRNGLVVRIENHGKGSHERIYLGKAWTTIKYRKADIGPGLLHSMCKDLGISAEALLQRPGKEQG